MSALDHIPYAWIFVFSTYALTAGPLHLVLHLIDRWWGCLTPTNQKNHPRRTREELGRSVISLAVYAGCISVAILLSELGVSKLRLDLAGHSVGGFLGSVAILYVLLDAYWYWTHRAMHTPWLYRISKHSIHHRFPNPTPWASFAHSVPETLINAAPYVVLPLLLESSIYAWATVHFCITLFAAIGHCGYRLIPDGLRGKAPLRWLNSPAHHQIHHLKPSFNFSSLSNVWDKHGGTNRPPAPTAPRSRGDVFALGHRPELSRSGRA